jgi:hypothetical protein
MTNIQREDKNGVVEDSRKSKRRKEMMKLIARVK